MTAELNKWTDDKGTFDADTMMVGVARIWEDDDPQPIAPTHVAVEVHASVIPKFPPVRIIAKLNLEQAVAFRDSLISSVQMLRDGVDPETLEDAVSG